MEFGLLKCIHANLEMDETSKLLWLEEKKEELQRSYKFCVKYLKTPLTFEEFEKVWYHETEDKKGVSHLANMCMSIFQKRKVNAGNSFEKAVERLFQSSNIHYLKQKFVDSEGKIYDKKPSQSNHKLDYIIPYKDSQSIESCIVISAKKTLKERYRQDLHLKSRCKKLIYLTNEQPLECLVQTIKGYDCILVYQNAPLWTFEHFLLKLKHFQDTSCNDFT
jgi:hypothetical protein